MRKTLGLLFLFCLPLLGGNQEEMITDALSKIPASLKTVPSSLRRVAVSAIGAPADSGIDIPSLQDRIGTVLLESGRFSLIDRKSLGKLVEEQSLSLSGLVDASSMVEAGRLIGVQGFFFGSAEMRKDSFLLNLKLVEVESGAILFSRTLTGSPQSFVRLGAGLGYGSLAVSDGTADPAGTPMFGFLLSYQQGFSGLRYGLLGVDLLLTKNFSGGFDLKRAEIKPKLYLALGRLAGWEKDYLSPYAGVSFNMYLWGDVMEPTAFAFHPLAGVEFNFARFVAVYAEGISIPATLLDGKTGAGVRKGFSFGAGIRFHRTLY